MDDPPQINPYTTLNVPKDATLATIRSAHRKLVLSCHPDKVQDESAKKVKAEQFHQVQQAYEILSDDKRRQRYDEKVKLDELRAEMASERGPSLHRRATDFDYGTPRGGPQLRRETRENVIYETREPKYSRYSDEDYPFPRYESRPSTKNYDDDYYHQSSARRTSGRLSEEKKRARDAEDERERRRREREAENYAREQRTKKRDKDKKRSTESKSKSKHSPYVDSASDSEAEDRYYNTKREVPLRPRTEEIPVRSKEDPRKGSRVERGYDDELEYKLAEQQAYISRTREPAMESESRRPGHNRTTSTLDSRPPALDSTKRPAVRRGYGSRQTSPVRLSKKDKYPTEIVDPPSFRKPNLTASMSESKSSSKNYRSAPLRKEPQRSATYQPAAEFKQPQLPRSSTMPVDRGQRTEPLRSSNLQNMKTPSDTESSDSDSEMTEDMPTPVRPKLQAKTTSYRVGPRDISVVEPEIFSARPRESSPKIRHSSDRPVMASRSSTTRNIPPLARAQTFNQEDRAPRPGFGRTESARHTPNKSHQSPRVPLYGEQILEEDEYRTRRSPDYYAQENSRSNKPYSRRRSEDVGRDSYLDSKFPHRPQRNGVLA